MHCKWSRGSMPHIQQVSKAFLNRRCFIIGILCRVRTPSFNSGVSAMGKMHRTSWLWTTWITLSSWAAYRLNRVAVFCSSCHTMKPGGGRFRGYGCFLFVIAHNRGFHRRGRGLLEGYMAFNSNRKALINFLPLGPQCLSLCFLAGSRSSNPEFTPTCMRLRVTEDMLFP